jgi:hypothetical protein
MADNDVRWRNWPVAWSAIWIGALAALAVGVIIGLLGLATGAHQVSRFVSWKNVQMTTVVFGVAGSFFAFVVGGWVAGRIAGIRRAEPAMLHGAVVWALGFALLLGLGALGATGSFGSWYGGLAGTPPWAAATPPASADMAEAVRGTALATLVAMLLGLVGSILGGWMASGEPMGGVAYYRDRIREEYREHTRRAA